MVIEMDDRVFRGEEGTKEGEIEEERRMMLHSPDKRNKIHHEEMNETLRIINDDDVEMQFINKLWQITAVMVSYIFIIFL